MKKIKNYLLSFFIPTIIFLIIATLTNHVPFGKVLFNAFDAYSMYPSLLVGTVKSFFNGDFFYSLGAGLGTDFYNIKSLYMNSPLNLLLVLFGYKNVYIFFTFLIYLRVGLSSLTMNIYLNSISEDKKYSLKQLVFSSIYSLCTYAVACSIHIMWMDAFILLPLIILGIDKLVDEEKPKLYIIVLSLTIFINFYIGYMICIFCVIYYLYKTYITNNFKLKKIKMFLISSLLSGLICSIILIPQIISLLNGRGKAFNINDLFGISKFSLSSIVYNFLPASYLYVDNYNDGSAIYYVTTIVFIYNILYFFNNKISLKEKKSTFIVILFFLLSTFINFIDFSWNMFQEPIWWSHRYIFVFSFFLIITAYKNYELKDGICISNNSKLIIAILIVILSIVSFSYKMMGLFLEDYYILYLVIGLLFFVINLNFYNIKKFNYILLILLIIEISFNAYQILRVNSKEYYQSTYEYLNRKEYFDNLKEYDSSIYRVINSRDKMDDSFMFDYNGVSLFSSSYNELPRKFLHHKVGVFNYETNRITLTYRNPAILSLLGVKYIVGNDNYYPKVKDNIYFNENALSLGFVVNDEIKDLNLNDKDYFTNIEKIYSKLTNEDIKLFTDIDYEKTLIYNNLVLNNDIIEIRDTIVDGKPYSVTYEFVSPNNGILVPNESRYYIDMSFVINDEEEIKMEGLHKYIYVNENDKVKVCLNFDLNTYYFFTNFTKESIGFKILDMDTLNSALNKIKESPSLVDLTTNNSVLSGTITTNTDSTLLITIPYQKGFTIYVDGKKTPYYPILDTFIGISLDGTKHTIKITYIPRGFVIGFVLSLFSLLLSIIYIQNKK